MNFNFSQKIARLLILSLLAFFACKKPVNLCVKLLQEKDKSITQRADSLIFRRAEFALESYRAELEKLRAEEKQLFKEVENCDFGNDLRAYNYWHRGRLKFPGKIEQELRRLEQNSIK
jgi:cell division protein FtsB